MKFASAQNAVVIEDDGWRITYHPRCPYCGYINDRNTSSVAVGSGSRTSAGRSSCAKCRKSFDIVVMRN